jgi:formylglycine-generating enzyme required for sulfatase activity
MLTTAFCTSCTEKTDPAGITPGSSITVTLPDLLDNARPLEMVLIAPGSFQMGCPQSESGHIGREWPPHRVTITKPFYLAKYEITQAQWQAVMGSNPGTGYGSGDNHPVYFVSWNDCREFIGRLNRMEQGTFRFPTEAEWEYACRAGTSTRFWFGDATDCSNVREYCELMDRYMWWGGNNGKQGYPEGAKETGLKKPNPLGLYDISGNVWEWCSDWWEPPSDRGKQIDPQGPETGNLKIMRGGAWESHALHQRSSDRSPIAPDNKEYGRLTGLRLVRNL